MRATRPKKSVDNSLDTGVLGLNPESTPTVFRIWNTSLLLGDGVTYNAGCSMRVMLLFSAKKSGLARRIEEVLAALVFLLFVSGGALCQSTGTLNGRVVDTGGGVVPDATVTAMNTGTGVKRATATNSDGLYSFPGLEPAAYDIQVDKSGFAPSIRKGSTLLTGATLSLDFTLSVATTSQQVEVTGEAPLLETTQSQVSGTLQTSEVQNLPMLNRNYVSLVTLVPGARAVQNVNSNKIGFGGAISIDGGTGRNVELEVDGVAMRDDVVGGTMFNMTIEGVQEFNVLPHDFGTQYGRTGGGVVLMTTKSGSNQLHGSAFAYGRSDVFTAIDYFSKQAGFANPPYDREQFGGSLGGPIKKDKIFIFGTVERNQQNSVKPYPSNAFLQAQTFKTTLLGLGTTHADLPAPFGNAAAFPGGIIPACPVCVQVGNAITPVQASPQTLRDTEYTIKGDYQINAHHSLFVRWAQQRINSFNDLIVNNNVSPHPDADPNGSNVYDAGRGYSIVGSETWLIGNNSVNTFAILGNHLDTNQYCQCSTPGPQGIYWVNRDIQFPSMQVGASQSATNQEFYQSTVQFKDSFAHQMGKHALKFGGDFSFFPRIGVTLGGPGPSGVTSGGFGASTAFAADPTVILASQAKWQATPSTCTTVSCGIYKEGFLTPAAESSVSIGQLALGGAAGIAQTQGQKQFGIYLNDDWKIKRNLTLNLGIRYDLDINWYNQTQYTNSRAYIALKTIGSPYGALPQTPTKDVQPRVGFAWDIGGKGINVLRASFGIFRDQMLMINGFTQELQETPQLNFQSAALAPNAGLPATYVYGETPPGPLGPQPGITNFGPAAHASGAWLSPSLTDPYNEQSHVGFTRQLSPSSVISVDYTHILGLHDFRTRQINPVESSTWDPNAVSYAPNASCPGVPKVNYRRYQCLLAANSTAIIGQPDPTGSFFNAISAVTSDNRAQYNDLTLHFERRSKRVTLQASYTLSYAYGFGGAIYGATGGVGAIAPMNPDQFFAPSEWGPTFTDERHHAVITAVLNLPWGIQTSPIFQIASPRPYALSWLGASLLVPGQSNDRPKVDPTSSIGYSQASSFSQMVSVNAGHGEPLSGYPSADFWELDLRVSKFVNLWSERRKLGLFLELYNLTNKPNFGNSYQGGVTSPTYGQPTGFINAGITGANSRQMQLGARFTF